MKKQEVSLDLMVLATLVIFFYYQKTSYNFPSLSPNKFMKHHVCVCIFQKQLIVSPSLPHRSVDHVLDMEGGSPKMGLLERMKAVQGDRKMSSPTLMITGKLKKSSPCSSTDSSPSSTLERLKKPSKPRSPSCLRKFKQMHQKPKKVLNLKNDIFHHLLFNMRAHGQPPKILTLFLKHQNQYKRINLPVRNCRVVDSS